MQEKIKITKEEFEEMYEVINPVEEPKEKEIKEVDSFEKAIEEGDNEIEEVAWE